MMSQAQSTDDERVPSAPGQRACDECRQRKIRCDRKRPCAHCRAASLSCRTTATKPEQKSRVMVSKQYENKIDRMDGRLASIEQLLRGLASQHSTTATFKIETPTSSSQIDAGSSPMIHSIGTGPNVDTVAAKELFEQTVGRNPAIQQSVAGALQSLQSIVGRLDVDAEIPTTATRPQLPAGVVLPSWIQVESILQQASRPGSGTVTWAFPGMSIAEFAQKTRRLYELQHRDTPSRRLLVYAGLFGLCCEFSALDSGSDPAVDQSKHYYDLSQIFQHCVLCAAAELPLILPPSKESVDALVAGSIVAVDMCKPSLSWSLASAAIAICQMLGYHRLSSMTEDNQEDRSSKIMLFWMAYMQDRGLALRLGRAPSIPDSYISLPKPTASAYVRHIDRQVATIVSKRAARPANVPQPLLPMLEFWIDASSIQGQICERLYSPAASSQPADERSRVAKELADHFQQTWQNRQTNNGPLLQFLNDYSTSIAGLMVVGDTVLYYGTMALILHAIPTVPTSSSPAVEYARKYLTAIRDIASKHCGNPYTWTAYCHWVLLNSPITPFTVMFCQVIAHYQNSAEDLQLMRSYVASLHPAKSLSSGVQKFYDLCSVFLRVAEAYIAAKHAEEASCSHEGVPATGEFDEYLSSLGFAPFPQMNDVNNTMDTSAYLQDWFTGNASLYGLLDMGIPGAEL